MSKKFKSFSIKRLVEFETEYTKLILAKVLPPTISFVTWLREAHWAGNGNDKKDKENKDKDLSKRLLDTYATYYEKHLGRKPLIYGAKEIAFLRTVIKSSGYDFNRLASLLIQYVQMDDWYLKTNHYPIMLFWKYLPEAEAQIERNQLWLDYPKDEDFYEAFYNTYS